MLQQTTQCINLWNLATVAISEIAAQLGVFFKWGCGLCRPGVGIGIRTEGVTGARQVRRQHYRDANICPTTSST